MKTDFFLGKKTKSIVKKAKEFGFDRIFFVKEVLTLADVKKQERINYDAILIKTSNVELLRRMIDKVANHFSFVLVLGTNDQINRIALEHKKVSALVSPECGREQDYIHYRNSGLNQVLCKIAKTNGKIIIINFRDVLFKKEQEKAVLLGRIAQNVVLCRKYKVKVRIGSFASKKEELRDVSSLRSFCIAIGMAPADAKNALLD